MATKLNITIEQGATYSQEIALLDSDGNEREFSANDTCAAELRKAYASSNSVSLTCTLANGSLTLSMSAANTANVVAGRYLWDAFITFDANNHVEKIREGIATVKPAVTR